MLQSSSYSSQFDVHVDNFNNDVLDLQQRDAQVATLDFRITVDDDIEIEFRAPERKRGRSASAVWNWFTDNVLPLNALKDSD